MFTHMTNSQIHTSMLVITVVQSTVTKLKLVHYHNKLFDRVEHKHFLYRMTPFIGDPPFLKVKTETWILIIGIISD